MSTTATSTTLCTPTPWPSSGTALSASGRCRSFTPSGTFSFLSLQFAVDLAALLHHPAPREWQQVADGLTIPFDSALQFHPEFDGYVRGFHFY